jgi:hypothetical protein
MTPIDRVVIEKDFGYAKPVDDDIRRLIEGAAERIEGYFRRRQANPEFRSHAVSA